MTPEQMQALRIEYEAGVIPNSALCAKYMITNQRLQNYVVNNGWVKSKKVDGHKVLASVSLFSMDSEENAVLTAANVVAIHRKDVAQLRAISSTLVERLGLELAGKLPESTICRGSRESPADLLEKLSRVMVRTTEIERQAYGLKTFSPEQDATDAQLQEELDKLNAELEAIANTKSSNLAPGGNGS